VILSGQAPEFSAMETQFIRPLSESGGLCTYHADISSSSDNTVTDIAILNNSTEEIEFPETSSIVIGINEISPLEPVSSS
jgi:hypothetical protein